MTRIAWTDDPDLAVTFDDLAEFTSALHRRSNFHFSTPKFYWFCLKKLVHPFALRRLSCTAAAESFSHSFRPNFTAGHYPNTTQETYTIPFPENFSFPTELCDAIQTKLDALHLPCAIFRVHTAHSFSKFPAARAVEYLTASVKNIWCFLHKITPLHQFFKSQTLFLSKIFPRPWKMSLHILI